MSERSKLNPNFAPAYCELGRIRERLGEYQQAINAENRALSLDQNPLAYCVMGLALLEQGNHERSIYFSEKAIELRPLFYEAWNNLGEAHLAIGQLERALTCFEKVLELAPAIPEVAELRLQIGTVQLKLGTRKRLRISISFCRRWAVTRQVSFAAQSWQMTPPRCKGAGCTRARF
jgi:tetratricopeptide (TPR) repeat protein